MRNKLISVAILTVGLAACGSPDTADETVAADVVETATPAPMEAVALLKTADGKDVGTATATQSGEGVMVTVEALGMEPGDHGVHVHTTGACTPDFAAAGGHWNPANHKHGMDSVDGQHAGDMPNLTVSADGTGRLDYMLAGGATFAGLMDADGSAFVIHAGPDDQMTDPSGDSGDRLACGVFETSGGTPATMESGPAPSAT